MSNEEFQLFNVFFGPQCEQSFDSVTQYWRGPYCDCGPDLTGMKVKDDTDKEIDFCAKKRASEF